MHAGYCLFSLQSRDENCLSHSATNPPWLLSDTGFAAPIGGFFIWNSTIIALNTAQKQAERMFLLRLLFALRLDVHTQ